MKGKIVKTLINNIIRPIAERIGSMVAGAAVLHGASVEQSEVLSHAIIIIAAIAVDLITANYRIFTKEKN